MNNIIDAYGLFFFQSKVVSPQPELVLVILFVSNHDPCHHDEALPKLHTNPCVDRIIFMDCILHLIYFNLTSEMFANRFTCTNLT